MLPKIKRNQDPFKNSELRLGSQQTNKGLLMSQQLQYLNKSVASLAQLFKSMCSHDFIKNNSFSNTIQGKQSQQRATLEEQEQRFKTVSIHIPLMTASENRIEQIKKFIADAASAIFSLGFHYYQQGKLNQRKYRLFCSHNLMSKIISFSQINGITETQLQKIDEHLSKKVLPFLKCKYPQSESNQSNLKLSNLITQLDNFASNSNDLIHTSGVSFQKKSNGDYSSQIMTFLNYIINITKSLQQKDKSLSTLFIQEMQNIFTKVESEQWVLQAKAGLFDVKQVHSKEIDSSLQDRAARQKYKLKVRQYSKYLIGKKISDNVATFSDVEINQQNLRVKNPGMMRTLTKWCQELQKIFNTYESISFREQMFRMRDGSERYLTKHQKQLLVESLEQKKEDINKFLSGIKANLYQNQSKIIQKDKPQQIFRDFSSQSESSVGYMTCVLAKCNENYLVSYLNKLIDCILDAEQLWMRRMNHKAHYKQQIPSLITFKVADLLRCKFASKQTQITILFSYLKHLSQKNPQIFQIVRVKNRLSQGTKDILINFRYRRILTAEMQLSVDQDKSNFIKCSDKANHFIYQLQRASFGPLSEISNVCYNVDERSAFYMKVFDSKNQWKTERREENAGQNCVHDWQSLILPIRCGKCQTFNARCSLITPHKKCKKMQDKQVLQMYNS